MLVYRFEHNRDVCQDPKYKRGGPALVGHGSASGIGKNCYTNRPNFGQAGSCPYKIAEYQHCAVMAEQWTRWIDSRYIRPCKYSSFFCDGDRENCTYCPTVRSKEIHVPKGWDIVVYDVSKGVEGIDWHEDNDQIVFNPAFAVRVGTVTLAEMQTLISA